LAFGLKKGCSGKLNCCNNCKIWGKLLVNENVETSVTSTSLPVDCLELKAADISKTILHTESFAKDKHHIQMYIRISGIL
jgi:hypothetical protein